MVNRFLTFVAIIGIPFFICYSAFCLDKKNSKYSSLKTIENYALTYDPSVVNEKDSFDIPLVPMPPKAIREDFYLAYRENKRETEKYLMLILLKVCREQLTKFHQTFTLLSDDRDSVQYNPILILTLRITKACNINKELDCDAVTIDCAYLWVKNHHYLLKYEPLRRLSQDIEKLILEISNSN